ncbi:hypothetical protein VP14_010 [Vibrio phage VPMCC14]|nr:hypothetical protein VP14_010 [Vibrio phage VPMCC14]
MLIPTYISVSGNPNQRLYFDALTSLVPTKTSTPTRYPVSDKSTISLNVVKNNPVLTLSGFVGQHPINSYTDSLVGYTDLSKRPLQTHEILNNWYSNSTELYIYNEFFQFDNYIITSYSPYQLDSTDTLRFDLNLEHLRRVSYERGTLIQNMTESKTIDAKSNSTQSDSKSKEGQSKKVFSESLAELYSNGFSSIFDLEE